MKKVLTAIGCFCAAAIILIGVCEFIPPKTLDFRGTVTDIERTGHETVFHLSMPSIGSSCTVVADDRTAVSPCHSDDPGMTLADIRVGDRIEGDFRWLSNDRKAKCITVWYQD